MCWDSLSDAGRPSGDGASRFGMRRGLPVANCCPDRVLYYRLVAASGVLEDPDFEVPLLEIQTVKIYKKSV